MVMDLHPTKGVFLPRGQYFGSATTLPMIKQLDEDEMNERTLSYCTVQKISMHVLTPTH